MIKQALAIGAAAFALTVAVPASGQGMGPGGGMGPGPGMWQTLLTKLCAKEAGTYCKDVEPGKLRTCLEGKLKELSPTCQAGVESTGPDRGRGSGPVATLCMDDIAKFCPTVEHAFGQVRNCLNSHKAELGEACVTALDNTGPNWHR
jgi:hypothetical protein